MGIKHTTLAQLDNALTNGATRPGPSLPREWGLAPACSLVLQPSMGPQATWSQTSPLPPTACANLGWPVKFSFLPVKGRRRDPLLSSGPSALGGSRLFSVLFWGSPMKL